MNINIYTNILPCSCLPPTTQPYVSDEEEEEGDEGYYPGKENVPQFQFYGDTEDGEIMVGKAVCFFLICTAFWPPQSPFDEFPDDDPFAEVQDSGDPDCEKWKKDVADGQAKLNKEGRILQAKINATEKQIDVYEKDQKKSCNMNCETGNDCCTFCTGQISPQYYPVIFLHAQYYSYYTCTCMYIPYLPQF